MRFGNTTEPERPTSEVRFYWINRWDPSVKRLRLMCFTWATGDDPLVPGWHSSSLSIGLSPRLFAWTPELWGWALTICGLRIHRKRAYGSWC